MKKINSRGGGGEEEERGGVMDVISMKWLTSRQPEVM